jgi:hypothetical protein
LQTLSRLQQSAAHRSAQHSQKLVNCELIWLASQCPNSQIKYANHLGTSQ